MSLERLIAFLVRRLDATQIRRWIACHDSALSAALPTGNPPLEELAFAAVHVLDRRNRIDESSFRELAGLVPACGPDVAQLAAVFCWLRDYPPLRVLSPPLTAAERDEQVPLLADLLREDGVSDEDALALAEELLESFPGALSRERSPLTGPAGDGSTRPSDLLIREGERVRLRWPPLAVSAWRDTGRDRLALDRLELITARAGHSIDLEIRSRVEFTVVAVAVTHRLGGEPQRATLAPEPPASCGGVWTTRIELDDDWGIEQFLFCVRPRLRERGARLVPPGRLPGDPGRPFAGERSRLLDQLGPHWLVECVVDHPPSG